MWKIAWGSKTEALFFPSENRIYLRIGTHLGNEDFTQGNFQKVIAFVDKLIESPGDSTLGNIQAKINIKGEK